MTMDLTDDDTFPGLEGAILAAFLDTKGMTERDAKAYLRQTIVDSVIQLSDRCREIAQVMVKLREAPRTDSKILTLPSVAPDIVALLGHVAKQEPFDDECWRTRMESVVHMIYDNLSSLDSLVKRDKLTDRYMDVMQALTYDSGLASASTLITIQWTKRFGSKEAPKPLHEA